MGRVKWREMGGLSMSDRNDEMSARDMTSMTLRMSGYTKC